MDIKQKLRELLTEKEKKQEYKYGCVMIYLDVSKKDWDKVQNIIEKEDLYTGEENESGRSYGKEADPHVTVLYGIHKDVPDEDVEALIDDISKPDIELQKVSTFENELFDVLKFDVESDDLFKLNKKFAELPHTTDYPDYHPHATCGYIKKGKAKKYIKLVNDYLRDNKLKVSVDKIVYSKANGEKKEYPLS